MGEPENEHCKFCIWLKTEEALEAAHIVEGLIHDRQCDDGVDQVRIRAHVSENSQQQRSAVAQGEEADVLNDVLQAIEKKDHAHQEQDVVIPGDHMFRAEVKEWPDCCSTI